MRRRGAGRARRVTAGPTPAKSSLRIRAGGHDGGSRPQVSGVVQSLGPTSYPVHAGQVIANLDPSVYQANAEQARGACVRHRPTLAGADLTGFTSPTRCTDEAAARPVVSAAQQMTDADSTPRASRSSRQATTCVHKKTGAGREPMSIRPRPLSLAERTWIAP